MKKKYGRPRKYGDELREQIAIEYLTSDKSRPELARKYAMSTSTVDKCIKEYKDSHNKEEKDEQL